jgi:DNA-binding NtrC family response regulator
VEIREGRFREDLYYRLNVFEIHLPALRERAEDVLPLARFFASRFSGKAPRLSPAAIACLKAYDWPGNVREIRNAMERASLISRGDLILPQHLPPRMQTDTGLVREEGAEQAASGMKEIERSIILETLRNHRYNRSETARVLGISRRSLIYKLHRFRDEGFLTDAPEK